MIKVGDKVTFLNDTGGGVVLEILNDKYAMVENEDGFDVKYLIDELVPEKSEKEYKLDGIEHVLSVQEKVGSEKRYERLEDFEKKTKGLVSYVKDEMEVDLHIEELIDSHRGMTNGEILSVQMAHFKRQLNIAIRRKVKKLIIIHGVGEGKLRSEIHTELLSSYPDFEFHDASYRKYGYGATEILIH
jgi:dsDNA-specific endonuclease/ATPase MutS2